MTAASATHPYGCTCKACPTTHPTREPWDPSGGAWISSAMPAILAKQAEAEEHALSCTERPCARCERFVCRCGVPVDGRPECEPCSHASRLARVMRMTIDSVPEDFRWALGAGVRELRASSPRTGKPFVNLSDERIGRALSSPPSSGLLLTGQTGSGKTTLAIAMLHAWVRIDPHRRKRSIYIDARVLARARAEHRLGQGEAEIVSRALHAPLLLLDDLGQEGNDRDNVISDVVYGRASAGRPTWITHGTVSSDLSTFAAELSREYDGGFVRRILETSKRVDLGAR